MCKQYKKLYNASEYYVIQAKLYDAGELCNISKYIIKVNYIIE